jgi:WD40 repeat protein
MDAKILASGSADETVRLWTLDSLKKIDTLYGHEKEILSIAISPDSKMLASGGNDKIIKLWDL